MEEEKNIEMISDMEEEGISSCCSAKVYLGDICGDCKEHCDIVTEE